MSEQQKKSGWRKYFKVANTGGQLSPLSGARAQGLPGYGRNTGEPDDASYAHADMVYRNYASRLPEVYSGHPNRIERYNQYEAMDMDSEINACLDILAEFSTQMDANTNLPFQVRYTDKPTDNEVRIIRQQLQQWVKLNQLDQRVFRIFRNTIKYGDQVFVRDPETFEMYWVDMTKVARVIVNESEGKRPEQYVIRDINPNFQNMTVAAKTTTDYQSNPPSSGYVAPFNYTIPTAGQGGQGVGQSRFTAAMNEAVLDAKHIVHLSLTEGLDFYWPFGQSVLETIFRVFKQKELLEDSVLIYRVARAPERRVFKIDVGNMPSHLAMQFVERVKNEIHQRRIPSRTGGGQNIMDSSYSPLSVNEDYFFPQGEGGRGSSVETLPGGCLAMDTRVPLLDGRTLTISELADEYQRGQKNWAYSCDPDTGKVVPGLISWAGITQQSAKVLKLTFDNDETLICTPDHKFPIMGQGLVRADQLQVGQGLIVFDPQDQDFSQDGSPCRGSISKIWAHLCQQTLRILGWTHKSENQEKTINRVVARIEILDQPITVGTLTIDQDEQYHAYHNFALDIGVFTQNSNLGEIDDLKYFNNKMCRGLRVPSSYLPTGPDDSDRPLSDGRVGTALIQEYRFNQYCERLQRLIIQKLDDEFKMFMRWRGFNIDAGLFSIAFNPPQNFASYREAELDTTRVNTFTTLDQVPYLSKRFLLKRYLGLTEDEVTENEELWQEERAQPKTAPPQGQDLRSVGISPAGIEGDLEMGQELAGLGEPGAPPGAAAAPGAAPGQQPAAGAAAPALGSPPAAGAAPTV